MTQCDVNEESLLDAESESGDSRAASNPTRNPRKGKLVGPKRPFKSGNVWEIRQYLKIKQRTRDLALFNLGIDSKLRGCDLLDLRVADVGSGRVVFHQATVFQKKTEAAVTFEITGATRTSVQSWIEEAALSPDDLLWPSRNRGSARLSMRQYSRIIKHFANVLGVDPSTYATHSIRRTKVTLIYRKTQNLGACELLLGHKKIENTVRYLGLELDDALKISRDLEIQLTIRMGQRLETAADSIDRCNIPLYTVIEFRCCIDQLNLQPLPVVSFFPATPSSFSEVITKCDRV